MSYGALGINEPSDCPAQTPGPPDPPDPSAAPRGLGQELLDPRAGEAVPSQPQGPTVPVRCSVSSGDGGLGQM